MEMDRDSDLVVPRKPFKPRARSKISNAIGKLPDTDGRTLIGRRFRDITRALQIDAGGHDLPEVRVQLIRRFAAASVVAEMMEAKLAAGEDINIQDHCQLCSTLVRISQRIGIDRIARDLDGIDADDPAYAIYERALRRSAPDIEDME
jgi:hypothetical protein